MRTRTSNRSKRFTVEKYDFESSSDERDAAPRQNSGADDERDASFDDDAVAALDAADHDQQDNSSAGASDSGPSEAHASGRASRQEVKLIKASNVYAAGPASYRDIEPVPSDSHAVKSYVGPYDRGMRGHALVNLWYGPHREAIRMAHRLLDCWAGWDVLPPKLLPHADRRIVKGVWSPGALDKEVRWARQWCARVRDGLPHAGAPLRTLAAEEAAPYQLPSRSLPVLMGPYPAQSDIQFRPGDACCLSQAGIPFDQDGRETKMPVGWMLDTGGIVLGMDWAQRSREQQTQLLALAVVPHADQEIYDFEAEHQGLGFEKHGVVQLWEFCGDKLHSGIIRPSTQPPRLQRVLCLDYGRARRVKWSPACDHLAILCGDGRICVVEVLGEADGACEKVQEPHVSLTLSEEGVKATAMAWVSLNRLVAGYSDGSVALWSIHPTRLLTRHPVHHSHVVDIATGYPSMPSLVASSPVGGSVKLIDLRSPSCETTEVQTNAVNWQPNLLAWSDHLLGFFSVYPSANALNTMVGFMHHRHFPLVRRIFTGECFLSCLSVGRTHPFLLVGTMDGSLWCLNPQCEIFKARRTITDRLRIFQHEHRPAELFAPESPASARGASRVTHGFGVEKNRHFMTEAKPPDTGKKGKRRNDDADEVAANQDPARGTIYELLTRLTAVEWNPNEGYGCWAAAAMGSGLVRVLDLGVENVPENPQE